MTRTVNETDMKVIILSVWCRKRSYIASFRNA